LVAQDTEYALRAMAIGGPRGEMAANRWGQATKVPAKYLSKVLQKMAPAGLITGRSGVGGGTG